MVEKNIKSRIVLKHDTESNWNKAVNFIPKQGEVIIYDRDNNYTYERMKIGDGLSFVSDLPFILDEKDNTDHNHDDRYIPIDGYVTAGKKSNTDIGANSTIEGIENTVTTSNAHAEGGNNKIIGGSIFSHAEGSFNEISSGTNNHIEGNENKIIDVTAGAHAEGYRNTLSGLSSYSHIEGSGNTISNSQYAHAEGKNVSVTDAEGAHAEGDNTTASGGASHAEGGSTTASGYNSHAEGQSTKSTGIGSHAEGISGTTASGNGSHAEGVKTTSSGYGSHAEGASTTASGRAAHVQGECTIATGNHSDVSGKYNIEDTENKYVEIVGNGTNVKRSNARTLDWKGNEVLSGKLTVGSAPTEDMDVTTKKYVDDGLSGKSDTGHTHTAADVGAAASGHTHDNYVPTTRTINSKALSSNITLTASDVGAATSGHTHDNYMVKTDYITAGKKEGSTLGSNSTAEGISTTASGNGAHAEGISTTASGKAAHAEGGNTTASGQYSHAEGIGTIAENDASHVGGKYNISKTGLAEIIGNGDSDAERSNARTLDWNGNEVLSGKLTIGSAPTEDMDVTTKKYVDDGLSGKSDTGHTHSVYMTKGTDYVTAGKSPQSQSVGQYSTVEGKMNVVLAKNSHAEGSSNTISENAENSHAEGNGNAVSGSAAHAEGLNTTASGQASHAEGSSTKAIGFAAHAQGVGTIAQSDHSSVIGKYNIIDSEYTYAEIVGNGNDNSTRSNIRTLDWDGNAWYAGKVTVEGTPTDDKDLTTKKYVDDKLKTPISIANGGTGSDLSTIPNNAVLRKTNNDNKQIYYTRTADGAFYSKSQDGELLCGTLPVAQGGTGATTAADARTKLGAASSSHTHGSLINSVEGTGNTVSLTNDADGYYLRPNGNDVTQLGTKANRWKIINTNKLNVASTTTLTGVTTIEARIEPNANNTIQLGTSSLRWMNIYSTKALNVSSDLNLKTKLQLIEDDSRYLKMFDILEPYSYMFKTGDRVHTGFISQYVEEAMLEAGLTSDELGFFCKDIKTKNVEKEDGSFEEVPVLDENGDPEYIYSLRYEEYIAILTAKIKQQDKKINNLEERLKRLEEKLK